MLISPAYAQSGAPGAFDFVSLLPLVLIFVVFYFLLIRPQQRKMKAHRDMIGALKRGDRVVTGGGIFGTVVKVEDDNTLIIEIAKDTRVKVARATVSELVGAPQAANSNQPTAAEAGKSEAAAAPASGGFMQKFFKK